jgi:hypothetical protein
VEGRERRGAVWAERISRQVQRGEGGKLPEGGKGCGAKRAQIVGRYVERGEVVGLARQGGGERLDALGT